MNGRVLCDPYNVFQLGMNSKYRAVLMHFLFSHGTDDILANALYILTTTDIFLQNVR